MTLKIPLMMSKNRILLIHTQIDNIKMKIDCFKKLVTLAKSKIHSSLQKSLNEDSKLVMKNSKTISSKNGIDCYNWWSFPP